MVQVILATHGAFCTGIRNSAEMIMGPQEYMETVSMKEGGDPQEVAEEIGRLTDSYDGGTLILADLFGGSPCNYASLQLKKQDVELVAGLSLPMLLQVLENRDTMCPADLAVLAVRTASEMTVDVRKHMSGK